MLLNSQIKWLLSKNLMMTSRQVEQNVLYRSLDHFQDEALVELESTPKGLVQRLVFECMWSLEETNFHPSLPFYLHHKKYKLSESATGA